MRSRVSSIIFYQHFPWLIETNFVSVKISGMTIVMGIMVKSILETELIIQAHMVFVSISCYNARA